jgi:hypothetical protein
MATLSSDYLTLADWAKRLDPDGSTADVVNLLSQTNEMMTDMLWTMGNQTDGHRTTVRTGLPQGTWRQLYQGVAQSKSTTAQITDKVGNLEGFSTIDKDLADLNGNTAQFRLQEDATFYEGMTQQAQEAFLYSNSLNTPAQIMGFTPRYNSLTGAATGGNIIDMGGTGSTNTSIWIVGWGPMSCFGMFPKGKKAGLMHEDLGVETIYDGNNNPYRAYRSHFKWEMGLVVRDWRYIARLANIDVTLLSGGSAANIINALISACHLFPTAPAAMSNVQEATKASGIMGAARFAIYCNRTIASALDKQALNKTNVLLRYEQFDGRPVTTFRGIPIRIVDKLLNTEARVV